MNLFVYEYITSGALIEETMPKSLAEEGDAMLMALVHDLCKIEELNIAVIRDARLHINTDTFARSVSVTQIDSTASYQEAWQQHLASNDFILIIAPETEQVLYQLQQELEQHDIISLGCRADATLLCTDKLALSKQLINHAIDTPQTISAQQWLKALTRFENGYIVKPIDGAGCIDTFWFNDFNSCHQYLSQSSSIEGLIVQPFIPGISMSIAAYIDNNECCLLGINKQNIEQHGQQLHFIGCETFIEDSDVKFDTQQAATLLNKLKSAITGLSGYIGIDIVITGEGQQHIVDINPRLTTGYLNIRKTNSALLTDKIYNTMSLVEYV
jgi:predicted ATP-grasp superfamily ATP-dependent carboligase